MRSCSLFFRSHSFSPSWPLAFLIFSHRRFKIFTLFFQRNWCPLFFISRCGSLSVMHVNVEIKVERKNRLYCCYFFIFKSPGGYAIYHRNARVLEMQNFTPTYIKGWTYVQTYGRFSKNQIKISWMHR